MVNDLESAIINGYRARFPDRKVEDKQIVDSLYNLLDSSMGPDFAAPSQLEEKYIYAETELNAQLQRVEAVTKNKGMNPLYSLISTVIESVKGNIKTLRDGATIDGATALVQNILNVANKHKERFLATGITEELNDTERALVDERISQSLKKYSELSTRVLAGIEEKDYPLDGSLINLHGVYDFDAYLGPDLINSQCKKGKQTRETLIEKRLFRTFIALLCESPAREVLTELRNVPII